MVIAPSGAGIKPAAGGGGMKDDGCLDVELLFNVGGGGHGGGGGGGANAAAGGGGGIGGTISSLSKPFVTEPISFN